MYLQLNEYHKTSLGNSKMKIFLKPSNRNSTSTYYIDLWFYLSITSIRRVVGVFLYLQQTTTSILQVL